MKEPILHDIEIQVTLTSFWTILAIVVVLCLLGNL